MIEEKTMGITTTLKKTYPRKGGHWGRMHPGGAGEFVDRFQPFERFQRPPGFAFCASVFPLCRHRPSPPLPLLWTLHALFMTCPVFGVHYRL